MKFRRVAKPEAYPQRYVEGFAAKYDFIKTSSLTGCGAIGCMLRIFRRGKTARVLPLRKILASPPMASATARFMSFAIGSLVFCYKNTWNKMIIIFDRTLGADYG